MSGKIDWNEYFYYDESSPSGLRWKVDRGRKVKACAMAGCAYTNGYYVCQLFGKRFLIHRIIYEIFNGEIPIGAVVDHLNGIPTDNRISNLRIVTQAQNSRNRKKNQNNTSGFTGITLASSLSSGGKVYSGWKSHWTGIDGKYNSKFFSIIKYGDELAHFLACEYRQHQIDLLNLQGAGYSNRHGE